MKPHHRGENPMLKQFKEPTPQWAHIDFSVNEEGEVVAKIAGNFPDPENVPKKQALDIFDGQAFQDAVIQAFLQATGPLREAFDRQRNGRRQMSIQFENIATIH
jgi:hypothetical protein